MAAVKIKGMVVANISDERSAYMTREHNGSRMVTMGPGVVGTEVAKKIAREFLRAQYAGGRQMCIRDRSRRTDPAGSTGSNRPR